MKKMSSDTEAQLLTAIEKSATYVNAGLGPDHAIAKAAAEHGISPGRVNLMVHAYNTGQTTRQRVDGKTPLEKAADFPLADPGQVLEILYPTRVKIAADLRHETAVSPAYSAPPHPRIAQRQAAQEKAAALLSPLPPLTDSKPAPYRQDPMKKMRNAGQMADRLRRNTEEARRQQSAALDKMAGTFGELSSYFRHLDAVPLPVARENIRILHGDAGAAIIDRLAEMSPNLLKQANHRAPPPRAQFAPATGRPYDLVRQVLADAAAYKAAEAHYEKVAATNAAQAEEALAPFVPGGGDPSVLDRSSTEKVAAPGVWQTMGSLALFKNMADSVAQGLKAPSEDTMVQKTLNKLTDPEHEAQLRGIHTQAMLQDFILNDPVISGHDPEDVMNAFNEITQLSPSSSDQRLAIQSMLRKRLQQGALDPFDVDQIVKLEDGLRRRNMPMRQTGGMTDGSPR